MRLSWDYMCILFPSFLYLTLHCFSWWSHSSSLWCIFFLLWYVYTIPTISSLLASTIMTSNSPIVAFGVTPNLSPSAKHQITHYTYPSYALTLSFLSLLLLLLLFLSLNRPLNTRCTRSHMPLLMFLACVPGLAVPCAPSPASMCPAVLWLSLYLSLCPLAANNHSTLSLSPSLCSDLPSHAAHASFISFSMLSCVPLYICCDIL